jgi:hypothetical protein
MIYPSRYQITAAECPGVKRQSKAINGQLVHEVSNFFTCPPGKKEFSNFPRNPYGILDREADREILP